MNIFNWRFKSRQREIIQQGVDYNPKVQYVTSSSQGMKIAAVYRAVSLISDSIGALPLVYKRRDKALNYFKPYDKGPGSALYNILISRSNYKQTAFILFKNLVMQVLLSGNAYAYLRKDGEGTPDELILLSPYSVFYDVWSNTYIIEDNINCIHGMFSAQEILHFKNTSLDGGYTGVSTIKFAAETLGIASTANRETLTRFANGGKIKGILQNKGGSEGQGFANYAGAELDKTADNLQSKFNSGSDIVALQGDGTFSQISLSSVDMQFLESRKFTITEIARFFNVPKSKLFDDSNANYKSSEMSTVEFYSDCLSPIMTMIENEFQSKLIPLSLQQDYKFKFDVSKLYTTDLTTKSNYQSKQISNGLQSVNDIRREEDLPPIDGGDTVFISCNVAPINSKKISGESE